MALPTASDNPFPAILITVGTEPAAPAAGKQRLYIDSTSHKLKRTDSSGTDVTIEGNTSTVATDAIWDTAGDIAVATGADAAAKLAIGNAGGAVRRINATVQWDSRTSSPTVASGDRWWRSDHAQDYYYDGTNKLSATAHEMAFPLASAPPLTGTGVLHRMIIPAALGGSDTYLASVLTAFYVAGGTALGASHKWVGTVSKTNTAGASSLGTITIDSGASDQWRPGTALSINAAAAAGSGYVALEINWVKTGTPGDLYANCSLAYRTIE